MMCLIKGGTFKWGKLAPCRIPQNYSVVDGVRFPNYDRSMISLHHIKETGVWCFARPNSVIRF